MFFQPFVKKVRWNLYCQNVVFELHRYNRLKPSLVGLNRQIVFNNFQTGIPNSVMVGTHLAGYLKVYNNLLIKK
ncbi:hypothetical protein D3C71_838370 [compost metagenome]